MITNIIDGRKIRDDILSRVKSGIENLPFSPLFCDILVGDNRVSESYVKIKSKMALSVGIKFRTVPFGLEANTKDIIEEIENLNNIPYISGIIVQLPLPGNIDERAVLDSISPKLDVDCLGIVNTNNFYNNNENNFIYPTALACLHILDSLNINVENKKILVLGQGRLVGLPVSHMLRNRGLNIDVVDHKTSNSEFLIKEADIIISAIGISKYLKGDMIKKGVIIIDAGTSEDNGSIVGDVDLESVSGIASYVSPTPGGVGPVTVAMLLSNVLKRAESKMGSINNFDN